MKLALGVQFLLSGIVLLTTAVPSIDAFVSDDASSEIFKGVKWLNNPDRFFNDDNHRTLQELPPKIPPARTCGQIINIATVDQIKQVAAVIVNLLLGDNPAAAGFALSTVQALITHDVQAQVVCASCNEMRDLASGSGSSGLDFESKFEAYCGEDRFAADTSYSSLLLIPFDPVTGTSREGILKPHLHGKGFSSTSQHAPTEYWADDFNVWNTTDPDVITELFNVFYDGWAPLMIASAGLVVIAPDYSGFGQTGMDSPKLIGYIGMYQQAFSVAFLKSKQIVESTGCIVLSNKFSASGYSEGGAAAVIGTNTLIGLGQKPLNVDTGGAPFSITFQFGYGVWAIDNSNETFVAVVQEQLTHGAATFSSKNPDVTNSNVGQNVLNDEWAEPLKEVTEADLPFLGMQPFLPDPATDGFNPGFLENIRMTISGGTIDSCVNTTEGVDDLLCQAFNESNVLPLVKSTAYPISICHSPDDTWVPRSGHVPDLSTNPLLSERTVFGVSPSGDHFASLAFCSFGFILQMGIDEELASAEPLEDPSACLVGTVAPASAAPMATSTMAPITMAPNSGMGPTAVVPTLSAAPVTMPPTTVGNNMTQAPVTMSPGTDAPVTMAPGTDAPVTMAPVTTAPGTDAPVVTAAPVSPTTAPVPAPSSPPSSAVATLPKISVVLALGLWATYSTW